ncbi:MAG: hypothetical protein R6U13_14180 [Desulfatiglandaceae bacterium]
MTALAGGLGALILGIIGIIAWWSQFIDLLMGSVPLILVLGGTLAAYLGYEEIKDKKASQEFETEKDVKTDLQKEVEQLREEIKNLKKKENEEGEQGSK